MEVSNALELELQEFESHLTWMPGTELKLLAEAMCVLNHRAISPAPTLILRQPFIGREVVNSARLAGQ